MKSSYQECQAWLKPLIDDNDEASYERSAYDAVLCHVAVLEGDFNTVKTMLDEFDRIGECSLMKVRKVLLKINKDKTKRKCHGH